MVFAFKDCFFSAALLVASVFDSFIFISLKESRSNTCTYFMTCLLLLPEVSYRICEKFCHSLKKLAEVVGSNLTRSISFVLVDYGIKLVHTVCWLHVRQNVYGKFVSVTH
jgi:hypothetical protein